MGFLDWVTLNSGFPGFANNLAGLNPAASTPSLGPPPQEGPPLRPWSTGMGQVRCWSGSTWERGVLVWA